MNQSAAATGIESRWPNFDELYREHAAHVNRFCLSQVGDAGVAEDLTHETFLRALGVDVARRPSGELRPWLIRIARNGCIDHHRRRSRLSRILTHWSGVAAAAPSVERIAEDRDRLRQVQAELQRLGRRERELIGLRVAADLSYRDIAEILNIGEDAAKVATHRALTRLRGQLQEVPARP